MPPSRRRGHWCAAGLAGLTGLATIAGFGGAASATGNTDGHPLVVPCSANQLIAAIVRANANGGAQLTLTRHCTYTLTAPQGPDGLPVVTQPIAINGQHATITRAASATNFRILDTGLGGNLILTNLTITGGIAPNAQGGGGLLVQAGGQATLHNTAITRNRSTSRGGGIANYGITTILGDNHGVGQVDGNTTQSSGGGVYNEGHLTTDHVTMNDNNSNGEGGGLTDRGTATLANTRIDHNGADPTAAESPPSPPSRNSQTAPSPTTQPTVPAAASSAWRAPCTRGAPGSTATRPAATSAAAASTTRASRCPSAAPLSP